MPATSSDTLKAIRSLEAAGIERRQAEAHAEALRDAATADHDGLATIAELAAFRSEVRWMVGFLAALNLAMAAKLFGIV